MVNSGKRGRKSFKNESQTHSNNYEGIKKKSSTPIQHISFVGRNKEQVVVTYFHHKIFNLGKMDQHHRLFMPLLEKCYLPGLSKMEVDSSLNSSSSVKNAQVQEKEPALSNDFYFSAKATCRGQIKKILL